jgi:ABC-type protease/lipase transport system fused ATPase/permease subunit
MDVAMTGAAGFGAVMGWITYRTLRRREGAAALSDLATVIGALGGAAITALFKTPDLFGWYSTGLTVGFFLYLIVGFFIKSGQTVNTWMGGRPPAGGTHG